MPCAPLLFFCIIPAMMASVTNMSNNNPTLPWKCYKKIYHYEEMDTAVCWKFLKQEGTGNVRESIKERRKVCISLACVAGVTILETQGIIQNNGVCHNCKKQIHGCESACHAMGNLYHVQCFLCFTCGNQLIGQAFYNVNGKIYCEPDYKMLGLSLKHCHFCRKPIKQKIIQALERWYHPSCFRCSVCDMELDGVPFTCDQESTIYCVPDYQRKFCPTCAICKKLIVASKESEEFIRVASMGKDFHLDCFQCEDCGVQLDVNKRQCYPQDHHLLCQKCWEKRTPKYVSPFVTPHNSPCNSPNVTPRCLPLGRPHILRGKHFK